MQALAVEAVSAQPLQLQQAQGSASAVAIEAAGSRAARFGHREGPMNFDST
jgi:hypothetical protein